MTARNKTRIEERRAAGALCTFLRQQVLGGWIPAGEFMPSVRELSEEKEMARNTVHRALRKLAAEGLIAAEPRAGYRVMAKANDIARGCPLGIVVPADPARWDDWDRQLSENLQIAAARQGRSLLTVAAHALPPEAVVKKLLAARAWGALLHIPDAALVAALARAGMPAVVVEAMLPGVDVDSVIQDGFGGAMLAASHLAEKGHDRIGWIGPGLVRTHPQITERYAGAVGGLSRFGKTLAPERIVVAELTDEKGGREAARRLLSGPDRPTAVLALWQSATLAVAQASRDLGLVPGRDFDMVGWCTDESYEPAYVRLFGDGPVAPAVTWSMATMMEIALARVEERRSHPQLPTIHIRIPTKLRFHETPPKGEAP